MSPNKAKATVIDGRLGTASAGLRRRAVQIRGRDCMQNDPWLPRKDAIRKILL